MRTYIKKERYMEFRSKAQLYGFRRVNGVYTKKSNCYHIVVKNSGQVIAWLGSKQITNVNWDIVPSLVWDGFISVHE